MVHSREGAHTCRTLDRGKPFLVSGGVRQGARVWVGEGGQPKTFEAELFRALLDRFRGRTVKIGSSFSDPVRDSVGEWLVKEWQPKGGNPVVYLAAILVQEGYAERVKGGRLRFFDRQSPGAAERNGIPDDPDTLRARLLTRIEVMPDEDLAKAEAALNSALGEQPNLSPFEALRNDPDFRLPKHPRPAYHKVVPVKLEGRPLSQDVIENRR